MPLFWRVLDGPVAAECVRVALSSSHKHSDRVTEYRCLENALEINLGNPT